MPEEESASGVESLQASTPETDTSSRLRTWGVLLIGLLVLVVGLTAWWRSSNDEDVARAEQRDVVLITARQHIETMNTLDYRKVDEGLASWEAVTTGKLKDSLAQVSAEEKKLLADQKKVSVGKVVDAAVLDLDTDKATVIAAIEVTVKDDAKASAEPVVKRNRFSATLVKVGEKWLIEDLQQVAVNLS